MNCILKEIGLGEFSVEGMLKVYIFMEGIFNLKGIDILVCVEGWEVIVLGIIVKVILDKVIKK